MATTLQNCIRLALDVTPKLRTVARELAKTLTEPLARKFLRNLALELLLIHEWLENLDGPLKVSKDDLIKLLKDLERICIYPGTLRASSAPSQFCPTLKALQSTSVTSVKRDITAALKKLASDESDATIRRRRQLLAILKRFAQYDAPEQTNGLLEVSDIKDDDNIRQDDPTYFVIALHKALSAHHLCHDAASERTTRLDAKLGLAGLEHTGDHLLNLEVLFLAHPHIDCTWQDAQVSVLRPSKVNFAADAEKLPGKSPDSYPVLENGICQLVSGEDQVKLALAVHSDKLVYEGIAPRKMHEWVLNHPSANLKTILAKGCLTHRMRLLLSIILAKAVWQFYNSDWMNQGWKKEHISFMYTCKGGIASGQLYASNPFLSTKFEDEEEKPSVKGRIHGFPKILSLGLMLLEIELDVTIESQRRPEHLRSDGKPNSNTDYTTAHLLLHNTQLWADRDTYDIHKTVIGDCITGGKFKSCANKDEERDLLYEVVVSPLEKLLKIAWPSLDEHSLGPMKLEPVVLHPTSNFCKPLDTETGPLVTQTHVSAVSHHARVYSENIMATSPDENGNTKHTISNNGTPNQETPLTAYTISSRASKLAAAADTWFTRIENISRLLRKKRRLGGYHRVRIAILDTGINGNHPHWNNISGWQDFVAEGNERGVDLTDHGTNGVDLLWRILPEAEIFVARVFERDTADARTPRLMAKAIRHAIKEWGVDIISLSAGFEEVSLSEEEHEDMRQAILEANYSNVLVFAAASNYGNIARITFPASMHGNVICIFSSTGLVKQSEEFNPAPSESSRLNFCILGEEVQKVRFSPVEEVVRVSGTSVATSIAAGIAALVIDFSRQEDCEKHIPNCKKLSSNPGMCAIFKEMSHNGRDNGYDCVAPWKLLECSTASTHEWDDAKKREHICRRIHDALWKM